MRSDKKGGLFFLSASPHRRALRRGGEVGIREAAPSQLSITPGQAKAKVFEHWGQLDALAKRRFPKDENLAHEALLYVLKNLEADDWRQVCTWRGSGHFLPFMTTLASRLLTDFTRTKFGHLRKPVWLAEKSDPLWDLAYRLLIVENYTRHEVIERLSLGEPQRERWFIEEVVTTIRRRCPREPQYREPSTEAGAEQADVELSPEEQLRIQEKEVLEALSAYLQGDAPSITPRVSELLARLKGYLHLSEEDRLLLKLRYQEGLKMAAIVQLLNLQGDPYKRLNKLIAQLRQACQEVGLLSNEMRS
jgi:hypothetical protein